MTEPLRGGRDYWFERQDRAERQCYFPPLNGTSLNLTHGAVPLNPLKPSIGVNNTQIVERDGLNVTERVNNVTNGVWLQSTWIQAQLFTSYDTLKAQVKTEYNAELLDLQSGDRPALDPYVYDLYNSVHLIEQYGEYLETLLWLEPGVDAYTKQANLVPGRFDLCECENLHKCPNGTFSTTGASSLEDCQSDGVEIMRRVSVIPTWYNETNTPGLVGHLANVSDFWELGGGDISLPLGAEEYKIGTIVVEAFDVLMVTVDLRDIGFNMTYGSDYQISVYVDCKPCPARYYCNYALDVPTCDTNPTKEKQQENFQACLDRNKLPSCMFASNGTHADCEISSGAELIRFMEPDLHKCNAIPFFCDDQFLPKQIWQPLYDEFTGVPLDSEFQEKSQYYTDPVWQEQVNNIQKPSAEDEYYQYIPGECLCLMSCVL